MEQSLLALKEIVNSIEVSPIEYSLRIKEFNKLSPKIMVTMPTLISKPFDWEKQYSLLGQIITLLFTAIDENSFAQKNSTLQSENYSMSRGMLLQYRLGIINYSMLVV